jgi:predicted dehydrogenase
MRGALIGCGFFAQNHLNAWRDIKADGIELVAVCDRDPAKAEAAQRDTHEAIVMLALSKGVRTIVQKPFAPDWDACVRMVEAAKARGVPLAVHENFRYQAPMIELRKVLESGVIGRPTWGRISFRTCYDVYRTQPYFHQETRFSILDVGIHVLDLARVFLGEAKHISCETQRRNDKNRGEDTATMMLRHESGAVSLVENTYEAKQVPDHFPQTLVTIEGERGSIKLHPDFRMVVTADGEATERFVGSPLLPWTQEPWHTAQESVLLTQRAIIDAWKAGRDAETSGADNLKTFALAEAAYAAAEQERAVAPLAWPG